MKKLLVLILLFTSSIAFSQKEANIWYFGRNAGIDFNTSPPTALTNSQLNTLEGCSSFSDSNGNLLFYSDGITVWDKDHNVMTYSNGNLGNNLKGDPSSTQSGMIVPKPGSASIYYLFTVGAPSNGVDSQGLNLYAIDMSLNNGKGQIIDEDNNGVFFVNLSGSNSSGWSEKVAAVKGKECNTFWVVSTINNQFYAYKISDQGVNITPVISTVNFNSSRRGYLKLSPNGSKLAIANQAGSIQSAVFDFNNETGEVSNNGIELTTFADGQAYGVEFSVDSKKLYISTTSGFRQDLSQSPTTYRLFQFDLDATNIQGSKNLIHQQTGFRGALQLGPDSKIYATIPLAYADPAGDAQFLSVIENPTANASDIIFTQNAINLNGRLSTQGLPPFISSLLLPIELQDSANNNNAINNQTLELCIGDNLNIQPESVTGNNITYKWVFDDGTTSTEIANTANLTINNLQLANAGTYKLTVVLTNQCDEPIRLEGQFDVKVYTPAVANPINDINFCDVDNDGFNSFDLQADVTPQVLNGQSATTYEVKYFTSLTDANNNTNALANPYTNPTAFSSQTIYARIHNIASPNACYETLQFQLNVTGLPEPTQPTDFHLCDDTASGSDTDQLSLFDLSSKDAEILGTLSNTQYSVSYHTTMTGASTSATTDVIDKNAPYQNTTAGAQTIYVRVENVDNTNCFTASDPTTSFKPFKIVVDALPTVNYSTSLEQCDVDSDYITTFNLTKAEQNISANHTTETFEYFATEADAIAGTPQVADKINYLVNRTATVWVRTYSNNPQKCYRISSVDLIVGYAADRTYNRLFAECDDFLDTNGNNTPGSNNDTDGITTFDFSIANSEIIATFPLANQSNLEVEFYESSNDRTASINEITNISSYRNINLANTSGVQFPIYYKIIDKTNNNCTGIGQIYLRVDRTPVLNTATPITLCDDFDSGSSTDGENVNINLRSKIPEMLGAQNPANFNVTFYTTEADAFSGNNAITNDTTYRNNAPTGFVAGNVSEQTIYVRVETLSGCSNPHTSFKIIVNPLPTVINTIPDIEVCDTGIGDNDPRNGIEQNIDLSQRDADILAGRSSSLFTVNYHKTQAESITASNPLPKTGYENDPNLPLVNGVGEETLWVSITDNTTGCIRGGATLLIKVLPEPNIPVIIPNFTSCDNDNNGLSSDTDGIIENITLKNKIPEILTNYPTTEHSSFNVTFHETQANATSGASPINNEIYTNTANNQTIYVRVEDSRTGCVNDNLSFQIVINPLPSFTVDTPVIVCLNNPQTRIEALNPMAIYDYVWIEKGNPTVLSTDSFYDVTKGGIYQVTATMKDGTGCERVLEVEVNESETATLNDDDIVIEDDTNNNSQDLYAIKIITENNNLGIGDYQFAIIDENGNQTPFQDEPEFNNIKGGIYTIIVNDKNGCMPDATKEVSVIQYPKYFTPNNDGVNDTWKIKGANSSYYPNSSIHIFDRYGKMVAVIPIDSNGWDGNYKGKQLPSNDYWFKIELVNRAGKVFKHTGHFSLLRR